MFAGKGFHVLALILPLASFLGQTLAQRPQGTSVCDFYAQQRYGANTSETQLKFIQNVVCLAFEGGSGLTNVSTEITGILRPGKFGGADIDLLQYFNGSRASTNVNNAAIGINWLDQGGATPLASFLAGETQSLNLANTSNQYHLFGNFFVAFSRAFGCTLPPPPLPHSNGPISLAYAHKFMGLEYNQLGYFINQLSLAATHFGVSTQEAETFRTTLNSRYNVRCAPAVSFNPSSPPQLLSLCQNATCPLAVPVSDCAAYANLTAGGSAGSNPVTVTLSASATTAPVSGQTSTPDTQPKASDKLSTGGIAGVAVGGAAVVLIAIIALVYLLRRRKKTPVAAPDPEPPATMSQQDYGSPASYPSSTFLPKYPYTSYRATGQPPSEIDTTLYQNRASAGSPISNPEQAAHQGYVTHPGHASGGWSPPPVEIGDVRGSTPKPQEMAWQRQSDNSAAPGQGQFAQQQHWGR
ncbi:hypothetical protein ACN47E_010230 [Coniothyrium glycines]